MARVTKLVGRGALAATIIGLGATAATAGGFMVREQGALGQGASFAGAGASQALSAMFLNSAAVTSLSGTNVDSTLSFILPEANVTTAPGSKYYGNPLVNQSTDIGHEAVVPASYMNHQFKSDPRLFIGLGMNSAFGLHTEPDKRWAGSEVGGSTSLFTVNFNPTLGYKFSDQLSVGVGAAFEYAKGTFKFATGSPNGPNSFFTGDDVAIGATAGVMYTPTPSTRIGLGWRSAITHELEGRFATGGALVGVPAFDARINAGVPAKVELRLPDIVNLSLQQAVTPQLTLLGSVEWTNWSRFQDLTVTSTQPGYTLLTGGPLALAPAGSTVGKIDAPWGDGWFFSAGVEYAINPKLTVRAGGAYEISPIKNATDRIVGIPDADRIWASMGFSYNISPTTTVDFGYSHVFVEEVGIDRFNIPKTTHLIANLDASVDIVSLGVRMKLGE
jgi:long-chain fatty acid transport protein